MDGDAGTADRRFEFSLRRSYNRDAASAHASWEENMKKVVAVGFLVLLLFTLSCAPGPNKLARTADGEGKVAGFWLGVWHGLIAPITFIISIFSAKVSLYEVHNSGGWYNFGFVLGAGLFLSGGILGHKKKSNK
jgi:hypothetical protein